MPATARRLGFSRLLPAGVMLLAAAPAEQRVEAEPPLAQRIIALRSYRAARVAEAIEALGKSGAAAAAALPELRALLDRPDPRVLASGETVPLRKAAATAILQITDGSPDAEAARAVLAGASPPASPVPERAAARVDELVRELADPQQREAAAANLLALGGLAALPLVDALSGSDDPGFRSAALSILRDLGRHAAAAVPRLFASLRSLEVEEVPGWCEIVATVAQWSRDVLPPLDYHVRGGTEIRIFGRVFTGATLETVNDFLAVGDRLAAATSIDGGCSVEELRQLLADRSVVVREQALVIARVRGSEVRVLLPDLAAMLMAVQPQADLCTLSAAGRLSIQKVDRSPFVHRLAARAILAIASDGDPLREDARRVLDARR